MSLLSSPYFPDRISFSSKAGVSIRSAPTRLKTSVIVENILSCSIASVPCPIRKRQLQCPMSNGTSKPLTILGAFGRLEPGTSPSQYRIPEQDWGQNIRREGLKRSQTLNLNVSGVSRDWRRKFRGGILTRTSDPWAPSRGPRSFFLLPPKIVVPVVLLLQI